MDCDAGKRVIGFRLPSRPPLNIAIHLQCGRRKQKLRNFLHTSFAACFIFPRKAASPHPLHHPCSCRWCSSSWCKSRSQRWGILGRRGLYTKRGKSKPPIRHLRAEAGGRRHIDRVGGRRCGGGDFAYPHHTNTRGHRRCAAVRPAVCRLCPPRIVGDILGSKTKCAFRRRSPAVLVRPNNGRSGFGRDSKSAVRACRLNAFRLPFYFAKKRRWRLYRMDVNAAANFGQAWRQ